MLYFRSSATAQWIPRIPSPAAPGGTPVSALIPGLDGQEVMTEGGVVVWAFDPGDILISPNVTTLSATDMSLRVGGGNSETAYVQTLKSYFLYDATSALTADGITILTATGGGRWLRDLTIPNLSWAYQASWFLNPSTGNDENSGLTSLLPIRTLAELDRRLSYQTLQQTTTVSLMGSYSTQYVKLTEVRIAENPANVGGNGPYRLIIQGDSTAWTTVFTSNVAGISSFQSVTRVAAGVRYAITDNNLGGTDPATFVGHRVRLTTGTHTGAITWVLKKLSATQFATGPFMSAVDLATGDFSAGAIVTPSAGDRYVIEDVVALKGIEIVNGVARPDLQDGSAAQSPFTPIIAHVDVAQGATAVNDVADTNITISGTVHGVPGIPKPMYAYSKAGALFIGLGAGQMYASFLVCPTSPSVIVGRMDGCCFMTVGVGVGGQISVIVADPLGAVVMLGNDCTGQGAGMQLQGPGGFQIADTGLGLYDCVGVPLSVNAGTFLNCLGILYGTNPSVTAGGAGVRIQTSGLLRYSTGNKPVITANTPGTNDLQLTQGSWAGAWTAVPLAIPDIGVVVIDNSFNIGHVYQTAITGNIGATNLFPGTPDKGLYTIDLYVAVTTAGAAGDQVTVTFAWTDDSQAETLNAINAVSVAAKGQFQARVVIETDGTTMPTWALSFPVKTGAPQVSLRIAARPMQNATA